MTQITTHYYQGMQKRMSEEQQQQKKAMSTTAVSYEQEAQATIHTGSPKLENRRKGKCRLVLV